MTFMTVALPRGATLTERDADPIKELASIKARVDESQDPIIVRIRNIRNHLLDINYHAPGDFEEKFGPITEDHAILLDYVLQNPVQHSTWGGEEERVTFQNWVQTYKNWTSRQTSLGIAL